jgi:aryl-alcohol dehydrogenase-like predicted oxidoreductase
LVLVWVLLRTGVSSTIIGATRPSQVVDNVAAADVVLSDEDIGRIEAVLQ